MMTGAETAVDVAREEAVAALELSVFEVIRHGRGWNRENARRFQPPLPQFAFALLRHILVAGSARASDIAEAFDVDKALVSRGVALLRERGLIEQLRDPDDGRAVRLRLAPAALEEFDRFRQRSHEIFDTALADWSLDDVEAFRRLMERFAASLP